MQVPWIQRVSDWLHWCKCWRNTGNYVRSRKMLQITIHNTLQMKPCIMNYFSMAAVFTWGRDNFSQTAKRVANDSPFAVYESHETGEMNMAIIIIHRFTLKFSLAETCSCSSNDTGWINDRFPRKYLTQLVMELTNHDISSMKMLLIVHTGHMPPMTD